MSEEMTGHQQFMCRRVLLGDVLNERMSQHDTWGEQNHDDSLWLAVLMEEVGEAATAVVSAAAHGEHREVGRLRDELVQVAAVAVQWVEAIDRRDAGEQL